MGGSDGAGRGGRGYLWRDGKSLHISIILIIIIIHTPTILIVTIVISIVIIISATVIIRKFDSSSSSQEPRTCEIPLNILYTYDIYIYDHECHHQDV